MALSDIQFRLRARRSAGMLAIVLGLPCGVLLMWLAWTLYSSLDFRPSAISNRVAEYSLAFVAALVTLAGMTLAMTGARWLIFALWPGPLGLEVSTAMLRIRLGPFGSQNLELNRLSAIYRFELPPGEETTTEDFMDPQEQVDSCLPILRHPDRPGTINAILERFIAGTTQEQLALLRPLVERIRGRRP